jgi:hypothetical protein
VRVPVKKSCGPWDRPATGLLPARTPRTLPPPTPMSQAPTTANLATFKSPRESPRAKRPPWVPSHVECLNALGICGRNHSADTWEKSAKFAIALIASNTKLTKRTVLRCYDGKPVRPSTLLLVAQAARIQGLGEPPGAPRLVRE